MNWRLTWRWTMDDLCGSDEKYFDTEEDAMKFVETLKKNPYRTLTSMYLSYSVRLIQICANCTNLFFCAKLPLDK